MWREVSALLGMGVQILRLVVVSGSKAESDRRYQMHRLDGRFVFGWMALSSFFVLKPTMLVVVSRGQLA